jgi:hypothetical protein
MAEEIGAKVYTKQVAGAVTDQALSSSHKAIISVTLKAKSTNTGVVTVKEASPESGFGDGFGLAAGEPVTLAITDLSLLTVSVASGDTLYVIAVARTTS